MMNKHFQHCISYFSSYQEIAGSQTQTPLLVLRQHQHIFLGNVIVLSPPTQQDLLRPERRSYISWIPLGGVKTRIWITLNMHHHISSLRTNNKTPCQHTLSSAISVQSDQTSRFVAGQKCFQVFRWKRHKKNRAQYIIDPLLTTPRSRHKNIKKASIFDEAWGATGWFVAYWRTNCEAVQPEATQKKNIQYKQEIILLIATVDWLVQV